jgi:hypothetical protein
MGTLAKNYRVSLYSQPWILTKLAKFITVYGFKIRRDFTTQHVFLRVQKLFPISKILSNLSEPHFTNCKWFDTDKIIFLKLKLTCASLLEMLWYASYLMHQYHIGGMGTNYLREEYVSTMWCILLMPFTSGNANWIFSK